MHFEKTDYKTKEYINDVEFIKGLIKNLEDTVYNYYPKNYSDILSYLHKAYDNMALISYKLKTKHY